MKADTLVSVVATLQNDGPILGEFVAEVVAVLRANYAYYELILVDDHSTDATAGIVEELMTVHPSMRLIRLSRRFGADAAITAGLDAAIGDYVVVIRPQSDPPDAIPAMIRAAGSDAGVVLGTTRREATRGPIVRLGREAFYWLIRRALPATPPPDATGFCVLTRRVVNAITQIKSNFRHVGFLSCTVGYAVALHPYQQIARSPHRRARPLRQAVEEAISIFITNSFVPLRMASAVGAFAALLNLGYVLYVILVNLVKRQVAEGWTTLSLQISVMFLFVFLNLLIISEYIARLIQESQDRPSYQVLDERASPMRVHDPERRNVV
jgi:glycosyltransferase involved in cell wall biosynthesis